MKQRTQKLTRAYLDYISFRPLHPSVRKRNPIGAYMLWRSTVEGCLYWAKADVAPHSQARRRLRQMSAAYQRIHHAKKSK